MKSCRGRQWVRSSTPPSEVARGEGGGRKRERERERIRNDGRKLTLRGTRSAAAGLLAACLPARPNARASERTRDDL